MPSIIIISYPVDLNLTPHLPPEFDIAIVPVKGAFVTTIYLPEVGIGAPVNGPVAIINLLSSLNGSTLGSTSSIKVFTPNPLAPIYFWANSKFNSSTLTSWVEKLTLNTFPTYPFIAFPP